MNKPQLDRDRATGPTPAPRLTAEQVWNELQKASFAVISHVTPAGKPRASGVVYAAAGRRLYVVTAADRTTLSEFTSTPAHLRSGSAPGEL